MATQPQSQANRTESIGLLKTEFSRGVTPTKDVDYLNVYVDLIKNQDIGDQDYAIAKRSGSVTYIAGATGSEMRGIYYNADFQKLYYVYGNTLYIWNVGTNTSSSILAAFFGTTTGEVGFTDYLYDNGTQVVVVTDGTTLKQISSTDVVTTCVDADLPVPHQPYPVFLDGYLFVLKTGTGDLYNSNLNDPMQWTAGDFISCEIQPDQSKRPIKLNNYIAVFGTNSIEYFWDAGNTSGSPLQRNDTPVKFNGYLGGYAQWGNQALFVGNNVEGQPDVFILEDLKMTRIGEATLTRYLASQAQNFSSYRASMVAIDGHIFYVLYAGSYTYVYDLETKQWVRWAFQQNLGFDMVGSVNAKTTSAYKCFFVRSNNSTVYQFANTAYQDVGVSFTVQGITDNQMFGTMVQKTMSLVTFVADRPPSVSAVMQISWSDNDYQSFGAARNVELNQERPSVDRLGRFRKRAFKWTYTGDQPFRIKGMLAQINTGTN